MPALCHTQRKGPSGPTPVLGSHPIAHTRAWEGSETAKWLGCDSSSSCWDFPASVSLMHLALRLAWWPAAVGRGTGVLVPTHE